MTVTQGVDQVTFAPMGRGDIADVIAHVTAVSLAAPHLAHENIGKWLEGEYSTAEVLAKLESSISIVARDDHGIVGTGFVDLATGYISGVYVTDKGRGTGRRIVRELLQTATEQGVKSFTASVHPGSAAMQHILVGEGFTATHVDPHVVYYVGTDFMIWEKAA